MFVCLFVCLGPSVFLMNYPSEEKDIPLKADSDPARFVCVGITSEIGTTSLQGTKLYSPRSVPCLEVPLYYVCVLCMCVGMCG